MSNDPSNDELPDFVKDLRIDPEQLDIEWLEQPIKFMRYAELSAQANDRVRKAEEKIKVVRSELSLEANEKGEEVLGKNVKPTSGNVEAYFRDHERHQAAKTEFFKASYEAEMLSNAVFAFHQRKMALENMVRLHGQSYYSSPQEPRDLGAAYREYCQEVHRDSARSEQAERIRARLNPPQQ